jgi:O-antigen/teichoic acid export membrane protein
MNLKDILASNQLFALLAKGIDGVKIICINVLIGRFLGPEIYGKYAFVIGLVSLIAIVAEFRLQPILTREFSKSNASNNLKVLYSAVLVNVFFSLVGFIIVWIYITAFEKDDAVKLAVALYSLSFVFNIPRVLRSYFISKEKNYILAKCDFFGSILVMVLIGVGIYVELEWFYLVLLRSLDFLAVSLVMIYSYFSHEEKILEKKSPSFEKAKFLVKSSAPLVLSGVAMILFQRMDLLMIRQMISDEAVGIYSAATTYMMLFSLAPMVLSESLAPKIFRHIGTDSDKKEIHQKFCKIIIYTGVFLSLVMFGTGYYIIPFLYGPSYELAVYSNMILSVCPMLVALGACAGQIIVSDGNQRVSYQKSIMGCVVNFILNMLLIPIYGIEGAAIATVFGFLVANFFGHWLISDYRYIFRMQSNAFLMR